MDLSFDLYTKWSGYATIGFLVLAIFGFILKWGFRFRLVGVTSFMAVLTAGLFALNLGLFTRTEVQGAVRFAVVYDNGANQVVITVPSTITESELSATLEQASNDLFSYGRTALEGDDKMTIRARALIHPEEGITKPLYLGQVRRSLVLREDNQLEIKIFPENLAQLHS